MDNFFVFLFTVLVLSSCISDAKNSVKSEIADVRAKIDGIEYRCGMQRK